MQRSNLKVAILTSVIMIVLISVFLYFKLEIKTDRGFLDASQAYVWGDMQGIEFQHRKETSLKVPLLMRGAVGPDKYDVLGLASNSKRFPYTWIVLNVNAGANGLFVMPYQSGYVLQCGYLDKLSNQVKIDPKVFSDLSHHCVR